MENSFLIFIILPALYYYYFLVRILIGTKNLECAPDKHSDEFITVIIPFRNEADKILISLQSIEQQDYPKNKFEVIYVDDASTDDSFHKISCAVKKNNVKIISAGQTNGQQAHKKSAIMKAVSAAAGEIIVTTDADCTHSPRWLSTLAGEFEPDTAMVSGPVEFVLPQNVSATKKLFYSIQKLEFQGLILAGAGLIGMNEPVICSAANLAYRKKSI